MLAYAIGGSEALFWLVAVAVILGILVAAKFLLR